MRQLLIILTCSFAFISDAQLTIEGRYMGKSIYVQNPTDDINEPCVDSVIVNGDLYKPDLTIGAFEIDFDALGFQIDDKIEIIIFHKEGCAPKVLNNRDHYQPQTFEFEDIKIVNGELQWSANNDTPGDFEIQCFRWNKWVMIDTINRRLTDHSFMKPIQNDLHTGENKLRIVFTTTMGKHHTSKEVTTESNQDPVEFSMDKKTNVMTFSRQTSYEIYDEFGVLVLRGKGDKVMLYKLSNKRYYLNLDNRDEEIKLKR